MKKGILWTAVFSLLICFQTEAVASVSLSGVGNARAGEVVGEYKIQVFDGGSWVAAGTLRYSQFFREQSLDLAALLAGKKSARVRLSQKGGGAAHIDAIMLGGQSPCILV